MKYRNVPKNFKQHSARLLAMSIVLSLLIISGCQQGNKKSQIYASDVLISDSLSWAERMADSEIYRRAETLDFGKSDPKAKWNYQTGLFLKSLLDLRNSSQKVKYYDFTKRVIDSYIQDDGTINTYKIEDYNIDKINSGKVLLSLFEITKDEKYKKAVQLLKQQLNEHPRTKEGGFWHKKRYPWQMWLDGIYMGAPFYARYSGMFNEPAGYDDVTKQVLLVDVRTRDPKTGLRYHGWDESNQQKWADPETGCSANFWGRAMGWYSMALVDILDYLPDDHEKRPQIVYILNDLLKAIAKYQDQETGLWFQVVDRASEDGNYLEASASSMFVYAFAKAVKNKLVDETYWSVAEKGYDGLIKHLIKVDSNGLVNLTQVCSVAGLGGDPYRDGSYEYYINEPVVSNDLKGVGPFIMASVLMGK